MMAATLHLAAANRLHKEKSSHRYHQQRTDPLEHAGNLLLMMMIACNQVMGNVDAKGDGKQRDGVRKCRRQSHHNRMPEASFSVQQIDEHRGFAVAWLQSMQCAEEETQPKT
jgi:hypothetical protein